LSTIVSLIPTLFINIFFWICFKVSMYPDVLPKQFNENICFWSSWSSLGFFHKCILLVQMWLNVIFTYMHIMSPQYLFLFPSLLNLTFFIFFVGFIMLFCCLPTFNIFHSHSSLIILSFSTLPSLDTHSKSSPFKIMTHCYNFKPSIIKLWLRTSVLDVL
jgi:hypothetical protein